MPSRRHSKHAGVTSRPVSNTARRLHERDAKRPKSKHSRDPLTARIYIYIYVCVCVCVCVCVYIYARAHTHTDTHTHTHIHIYIYTRVYTYSFARSRSCYPRMSPLILGLSYFTQRVLNRPKYARCGNLRSARKSQVFTNLLATVTDTSRLSPFLAFLLDTARHGGRTRERECSTMLKNSSVS